MAGSSFRLRPTRALLNVEPGGPTFVERGSRPSIPGVALSHCLWASGSPSVAPSGLGFASPRPAWCYQPWPREANQPWCLQVAGVQAAWERPSTCSAPVGKEVVPVLLALWWPLARDSASSPAPAVQHKGGLGEVAVLGSPVLDGVVAAQEAGGLPAGTGMDGCPDDPSEYEEAVASLWQDADPQAQKVLRACGIEPPKADADADPRVTLHKYLAAYKSITQAHRSLVELKVQLQARADRIKTQFEQALKELADVSKDIATAEDNLSKVQNQVQEQLKNAEPPEAKEVHDLQGLLKAAGVELSASQEGALSAYLHTRRDGRDHEEEEDGMEDPFQGLSGKIPSPRTPSGKQETWGAALVTSKSLGLLEPGGCEATLCPARRRKNLSPELQGWISARAGGGRGAGPGRRSNGARQKN